MADTPVDTDGDGPEAHNVLEGPRMPHARRTWIAASLGVLAFVLYAADLLGLKPPPRILPSAVLAITAVVVGVSTRQPEPADGAPRVPAQATSTTGRVLAVAGLGLHLLLLVPILPIGLVAPGSGVLAIHGTWLVGLILAWRLRLTNPPVVLAIPLLTAAMIAAILWVGTTMLGWQP